MRFGRLGTLRGLGVLPAMWLAVACSSKEGPVLLNANDVPDTGTGLPDGGTLPDGPAAPAPDGGTSPAPDSGEMGGALDAAPPTSLPALPTMSNVTTVQREDSVGIDFDPIDDAVDYRVYELPKDGDITVNGDGSLAIKNAVYRCAGLRQTFHVPTNLNSHNTGNGVIPTQPGVTFASTYPSITADVPDAPTLGYVYTSPATNSAPVYAVGTFRSGRRSGLA